MNATTATLVAGLSAAAVTLTIGLITLAVGKGGRRADAVDKISESADRWLDRADEHMESLTARFAAVRKVLRNIIRAARANETAMADPAISTAVVAGEDVLDTV